MHENPPIANVLLWAGFIRLSFFSCLFIYRCIAAYFPNLRFVVFNKILYISMLLYAFAILFLGFDKWYSATVAVPSILLLVFLMVKADKHPFLPLTFLLSMIPFFAMNGVLTGSFTAAPVVWYNAEENIGFRLGTIPAEDVLYGLLLIVGNILLLERFGKKKRLPLAEKPHYNQKLVSE